MSVGWRKRAACQSATPELFFPEDHIANAGTKEWRAEVEAVTRRWCLRCPVRLECFAWSVEDEGESARGVWGGVDFLARKPWVEGEAPVRCGCGTILDPLPRIRLGEDTRTCAECEDQSCEAICLSECIGACGVLASVD